MAERYREQSALAALGLLARAVADRGDAGIAVIEPAPCAQWALRGDSLDAGFVAAAGEGLGFDLPVEPLASAGDDAKRALWLGPSEWLVVSERPDGGDWPEALAASLIGQTAALVEQSDSRFILELAGPNARDLLAKAIPLDIHSTAFPVGRAAQTVFAKTHVLIHLRDEDANEGPRFDLYFHRSFAGYVWAWLADAAGEYGLAVLGP